MLHTRYSKKRELIQKLASINVYVSNSFTIAELEKIYIERTKPIEKKAECCICMDEINKRDQIALPCNHIFHNKCIKLLCKMTYGSGHYHPNYIVDVTRDINTAIHSINQTFSCPLCRCECAQFPSGVYKKVIGRIWYNTSVHHISDEKDILTYLPNKDKSSLYSKFLLFNIKKMLLEYKDLFPQRIRCIDGMIRVIPTICKNKRLVDFYDVFQCKYDIPVWKENQYFKKVRKEWRRYHARDKTDHVDVLIWADNEAEFFNFY